MLRCNSRDFQVYPGSGDTEDRPGSWGLTARVERPGPRTESRWDAELGSQGQRPVPGGLQSQGWEFPENRFRFSMQDLLAVQAAGIWMEQAGIVMSSSSLEVCKLGLRPPCGCPQWIIPVCSEPPATGPCVLRSTCPYFQLFGNMFLNGFCLLKPDPMLDLVSKIMKSSPSVAFVHTAVSMVSLRFEMKNFTSTV